MNKKVFKRAVLVSAILTAGCDQSVDSTAEIVLPNKNPFPSTYAVPANPIFALVDADILTGDGAEMTGTDLLIEGGKIIAIGKDLPASSEFTVVDAAGKWITPGIIDIHSHMGVYSAPGVTTSSDGNESTSPVTADVWAEHSIWVQDPQFEKALAGGVTTLQILPGSGNLIGGRGVTLKNVRSLTVQGMKFPGAPYSLKMACGENPKGYYGSLNQLPSTRMGNMAGYRAAWIEATEYKRGWDNYVASRQRRRGYRSAYGRDL